jgi:predicted MFS family arabinose efflux permease
MNSPFSNSRMVSWMIWTVASVFYAYQYVLRVMPNIMLHDIMQQFHIDTATFGQFSGVYYIGYSLLHLPVGILLDRFGPKKIMSGCILLTVLGLSPLLFATHWIYPIIGRFLIGLGSSAAILGVFKIIRMAFKEQQFPRMLSLSVTIGLMGAIYGGGPVHYMRETFGYEAVIYGFAIMGLALALAPFLLIPTLSSKPEGTVLADIKEVLRNGKVIGSCIFAGLMVGPLEGFADVWGTAFLKVGYQMDGSLAASLPSMIYIGMCFGSPILSFIADKVGSYLLTIIGAGVLMTTSFVLMLTASLTTSILTLSFICIGIASAYQILAIYKASTYVREQVAGLTTAMANMIIMIFGYVFHTLIGTIIKAMGGQTQAAALFSGVWVIPIALCIGSTGFLFLFLQERGLKKQSV